MGNLSKFLISLTGLVLLVGVGTASAKIDVGEEIKLDETVEAKELGISEPRLLPDSPFYFLKNWGRGIQSLFTFNPVAKAELRSKFANEKLLEVKKLIDQKKSHQAIENGIENYQEEVEEVKKTVERIKEKAAESLQVSKFLDKFIQHQTLHQRVLEKLEVQVPAEVFEKIEAAREQHLQRFSEVMTKLEGRREELGEKLEKNMEEIEGSKFKTFKNLEVLKDLEEKVPEEAKEAIRHAQENALKRLKGNLEAMSPEDHERFKEYIDKISGLKERKMEILENLRGELKERPEIHQKLLEARETILERIEERHRDCPEIEKPAADFCKEGRVVIERNPETGCPLSPRCVIPAEAERPIMACITLWDPVCGKDGKTYSNACFAKLAGVEIAQKGECKEATREVMPRLHP